MTLENFRDDIEFSVPLFPFRAEKPCAGPRQKAHAKSKAAAGG
jgi:hypothetical protein